LQLTERVCVNIPGQGKAIVEARADPADDDRDIAIRLAERFPVGTTFGFAGAKWKSVSKDPPGVVEVGAEAPKAGLPKVGQVWKPKDPRRVSSFKVASVTSTDVVADDGRRVSLDRWSRYTLVS
jgi:hypothetical protein